ncbi:TnsD family Tn7-like transposition protein [Achromobacter sp.]|uniref:TnsD family Tn7-like transposition protein n=1 Tax=Achromobacter sp. TaxID=134375 RepID=UPI003C7944B0
MLGPTPRPPEATSRSLLALAKLTNDAITAMPSGGLQPEVLTRAYSTATTGGDSIVRSHLMRELGAEYAHCVAPLRAIPELEPLARDAKQGISQIQPVLSGQRWITHPLRHFALILWLFSDWKTFNAAYSLACDFPIESDQPIQGATSATIIDRRQAELAAALSRGASVTSAAKMVGVTVNTAIAWATKAAITTPRRPKRTQEHTRKLIIQALKNGESKCKIASRHEVTVQTVTRILLSEIGLQEQWHEVVMRKRQLAARQEWTTAMQQNGDASRKMLRAIAPRAFAWLYRNDRDWLIDQQLLARPSAPRKGQIVDWDSRDKALACCIERTALELYHSDPLRRITLQQLYQAIPELKRRLGQLRYLPLTRSRIDRVTARARLENRDPPLL